MTIPDCPKCHARMEAGFMVDHTYGTILPPEWAEGEVNVSFWLGVKMKGKERRRVETLRCMKCGYLESYARDVVQ